MSVVNLTEQEWGQVMAIIATAPWRDANPLLMKIGDQLRAQAMQMPQPPADFKRPENSLDGRREVDHERTN